MTWCDGCYRAHQQTSEHITSDGRMELLCGPCWRYADYWDDIEPWWRRAEGEVAA